MNFASKNGTLILIATSNTDYEIGGHVQFENFMIFRIVTRRKNPTRKLNQQMNQQKLCIKINLYKQSISEFTIALGFQSQTGDFNANRFSNAIIHSLCWFLLMFFFHSFLRPSHSIKKLV